MLAIIAKNEVAVGRYLQLAVVHQAAHLHPPAWLLLGHGIRLREVIAITIQNAGRVHRVHLLDRVAVYIHTLVDEVHAIARESDHALHEVLLRMHRRPEDDDVSTVNLPVGQHLSPYPAVCVVNFVYQQEIANQQRIFHGFRRDLERLKKKGDEENRDNDGHGHRLQWPERKFVPLLRHNRASLLRFWQELGRRHLHCCFGHRS